MSLNERIMTLTQQVNDFLSKDTKIDSQKFIELSAKMINYSDLASHLDILESEERKESEYDWIWKENTILNLAEVDATPIDHS